MTSARGPLDRLLDLVVFAPLGLALRAREELSTLSEHGRQKFDAEANLARMVGQMAVAQGRRRAETLLLRPGRAAGPDGAAAPPSAPSESAEPRGRAVPVHDLDLAPDPPLPVVANEVLPEPAPGSGVEQGGGPSPDSADLPIPGYDSLSASQVVQRLPGLSPDELEAIRSYEAARRGRKTVLLRVAQLRAAS
jgi:hypothetical protein